ncbi:hypothetical protein BJ546DRAFT_43929 [Cryomyces antarcticus]
MRFDCRVGDGSGCPCGLPDEPGRERRACSEMPRVRPRPWGSVRVWLPCRTGYAAELGAVVNARSSACEETLSSDEVLAATAAFRKARCVFLTSRGLPSASEQYAMFASTCLGARLPDIIQSVLVAKLWAGSYTRVDFGGTSLSSPYNDRSNLSARMTDNLEMRTPEKCVTDRQQSRRMEVACSACLACERLPTKTRIRGRDMSR